MDNENDEILRLRIIPYNIRLVNARKELGFTQVDVGLIAGVSHHKLGQIETLRRLATDSEKDEIASALGNTTEYLFPEELELAISAGVFGERQRLLTGRQVEALTSGYTDAAIEKFEEAYMLPEAIEDVLATLTPRERRVIELRFGFIDGRNRTFEEIGEEFYFTKERVRQIVERALRKLRHPSQSRKLKGWIDLT